METAVGKMPHDLKDWIDALRLGALAEYICGSGRVRLDLKQHTFYWRLRGEIWERSSP
jgi:hypothetical protein